MFNCAFGEVSVALQNERDTFYESFKASAAEAVKYAELTQKAAYQSIHEVVSFRDVCSRAASLLLTYITCMDRLLSHCSTKYRV